MSNDLNGKVVLITGAGKGLGRRLAFVLAKQGAKLALNDISPMNVELVADELSAAGGQAQAFVHDIAKKVTLQSLVNEVTDAFGRIDVLVNCANVEPHGSMLDMDEWDLHRTFEVNAIGTFLVTQVVGRVMRAQGEGIIIQAAKQAKGQDGAAFVSSQSAVLGLTAQAAAELRPHQIQVYGLAVGLDASAGESSSLAAEDALLALCRGEYASGTVLKIAAEA